MAVAFFVLMNIITKEDALNVLINAEEAKIDKNKIFDGYHTFGELYEHRITLYIALCSQRVDATYNTPPYESSVWRSKAHSDGSVWEGWFILGIFKEPGKQITYHLPIERWKECSFAEDLDKAPPFDNHTSEDVLKRIKLLL